MHENDIIRFQSNALVKMLVLTGIALFAAHAAVLTLTFAFGHNFVYGLVPLFNFALEQNIPTYYSTLLLLLVALLFYALGRAERSDRHVQSVWLLLSAVFLFLSIDEFAGLHELLVRPVRELADTSGIFFYGWIIPYGIAVLLLAVIVLPVILRQETRFRALLVASALVYLTGAMGVEMLEGSYAERVGSPDLTYRLLQTIQELLEVVGLLILIRTLLDMLKQRNGGFGIIVS